MVGILSIRSSSSIGVWISVTGRVVQFEIFLVIPLMYPLSQFPQKVQRMPLGSLEKFKFSNLLNVRHEKVQVEIFPPYQPKLCLPVYFFSGLHIISWRAHTGISFWPCELKIKSLFWCRPITFLTPIFRQCFCWRWRWGRSW